MLEGLRKIDGSKNYYQAANGDVYHMKKIQPYKKGSKNYYQIQAEDGSKIYYSSTVVESTTNTNEIKRVVKTTTEAQETKQVVKSTTNINTAPKGEEKLARELTSEEIRNWIF